MNTIRLTHYTYNYLSIIGNLCDRAHSTAGFGGGQFVQIIITQNIYRCVCVCACACACACACVCAKSKKISFNFACIIFADRFDIEN